MEVIEVGVVVRMDEEISRIQELYSTELSRENSNRRYGWTNEWDRLLQIEEGTLVPEEDEVIVECDILKYAPMLVRAVEFFFNPWIVLITCYLYVHTIIARIILLTDDIGASVVTLIAITQGLISVMLITGIIKGRWLDPIGRNKMVRIRSTELQSTRHFVQPNWPLDWWHDWQVYMCENVACKLFQPFDSDRVPTSLLGQCCQWFTKSCLRCGKRQVPPESHFGEHPVVQCLFCNSCGRSEIRYRKTTDIFQAYGYFDLIEKGTKFTVHNWTKSFIPDRQTEYFMSIFITVLAFQTMYVIFIQNAEYITCRNDYPVKSFEYCSSSFDEYKKREDNDEDVNSNLSFKFCCRLSQEFVLFGAFFINNFANTFGASILIVGLTTLLYGANVLNAMGRAWVQRYREATPDDISKERKSKLRANRLADLAASAVREHAHNRELASACAVARVEIGSVASLLSQVINASIKALGSVKQNDGLCIFSDTVLNQISISACEAFYAAFHGAFLELRRNNSKGSSLYAAFMSIRAAADVVEVFPDYVISACHGLKKFKGTAGMDYSEEYQCLKNAYLNAKNKFLDLSQWNVAIDSLDEDEQEISEDMLKRSSTSLDAEKALERMQVALEEHKGKELRQFGRLYKQISSRYNASTENIPDFAELGLDATISVQLTKLAVTMYKRYCQLITEARRAAARAIKEDEATCGEAELSFLPKMGHDRIYRRMQNIIELDNQRRRRAQSDVETEDDDLAINTVTYAVAFVGAYHYIDKALRLEAGDSSEASSPISKRGNSQEMSPSPGTPLSQNTDGIDTIAQAFLVMGVCADVAVVAATDEYGSWPTDLSALYSDVFDIAFAKYDRISKKKKQISGYERMTTQLLDDSFITKENSNVDDANDEAKPPKSKLTIDATEADPCDDDSELVVQDAKEMYCFIEQFSAQSSNLWKVLLAEEFIVRPALLIYCYYVIIFSFDDDGTIDSDLLGNTLWLGSIMTFLIVFYMYAMAYANMVSPKIIRALRFLAFCDFKYFGDRSDMIQYVEDRAIEWGIFGFVVNRSLLFSIGGGLLTGLIATLAALLF